MIKPNKDDMNFLIYEDDYYPDRGFKVISESEKVIEMNDPDSSMYDQLTTYILEDTDQCKWRVVFRYNSWGDDQFEIAGPVMLCNVVVQEWLSAEELANLPTDKVLVGN